jgi:hypothetical protein
MTFARYWIWTGGISQRDPLPGIGSGVRGVNVNVGRKHVKVRTDTMTQSVRIPISLWHTIPHTLDTGQEFTQVLEDLSAHQCFTGACKKSRLVA